MAGSLAEWLADHPVMMGRILPMVLQGLVKEELSVSSVSTLKRICRECRHDLCPFAEEILSVSQVKHSFISWNLFFIIHPVTKLMCPSAGRTAEKHPQGE